MTKKIILDCDPGHDDAIALLLAHGNPDIELLAVTTVVGNQTLEKVTRNALAVARIANITGFPLPPVRHARWCVRLKPHLIFTVTQALMARYFQNRRWLLIIATLSI